MSICYTGLHGIPMGRQHRPLVAWYGDLDFMPHIKAFIARGAVDAVVSYGEPVAADGSADRKAMTKSLEGAVRTHHRGDAARPAAAGLHERRSFCESAKTAAMPSSKTS